MKIFDLLTMCLRNLLRRKFRTFLTITGVVIGTCSIVVMISLGIGIRNAQDEMFQNLGDLTIIDVYSYNSSTEVALDDAAVSYMQSIPHVQIATPFIEYQPPNSSMTLFAGRRNRYANWISIVGVKPEALPLLGYTIAEGASLEQSSASGKIIPLISGDQYAYSFEDTKKKWPNNMVNTWTTDGSDPPEPFFDPLEQQNYQIVLPPSDEGAKTLTFNAQMVGILASEEYDWEKRQACFMDIEDLKQIKRAYERENGIRSSQTQNEQYTLVKVKVDDIKNVSEVQEQIESLGFFCDSMQQYRDQMQESTQQIQLILAILGGVSLLVAAISITNTMIMSVYERTREIGIMKVLGCFVGNIRLIFLIEAGCIGFFGGVVGVMLSYLVSYLLNTFGHSLNGVLGISLSSDAAILSIIPFWLVLLSLIFSTLIGLIAGFYPANRAVKISVLDAIKQE